MNSSFDMLDMQDKQSKDVKKNVHYYLVIR